MNYCVLMSASLCMCMCVYTCAHTQEGVGFIACHMCLVRGELLEVSSLLPL